MSRIIRKDVQDLSDQLKMNSFNTGEPENSGLSRTQLMESVRNRQLVAPMDNPHFIK